MENTEEPYLFGALNELFKRGIFSKKCPMCGERNFSVHKNPIYNLVDSESVPSDTYTKCVPPALITCEECGLMLQYCPEVLGITNLEAYNVKETNE